MPRTKTTQPKVRKSEETKSVEKSTASTRFSNLQLNRSYTSLIYGIITVIVLFALIFAGVRNFTDRSLTPDIADDGLQTISPEQNDENMYTVQEGDSLWSIAEQKYNDGFKWNLIAQANELKEPYALETGTKLQLPDAPSEIAQVQVTPTAEPTPEVTAQVSPTSVPAQPTTVQSGPTTKGGLPIGGTAPEIQQPNMSAITGTSYTVQSGDNLWNIAVRAYGDGFKWGEIATANSLSNPRVIHSGNVITLPR